MNRYRNAYSSPKESLRYNPSETFSSKEILTKRPNYIKLSNNNLRFPFNPSAELLGQINASTSVTITPAATVPSKSHTPHHSHSQQQQAQPQHSFTITRTTTTDPLKQNRVIDLTDRRSSDREDSARDETASVLSYTGVDELKNPKEVLDEILLKRSSSPSSYSDHQPHSSVRSPGPSSSAATTPQRDILVLQDGSTIEEETKCDVCGAIFPSVWLLEQHAALQHSGSGDDDKPFICEQCGQSYRYRSAYLKHREQNHRARLPADKLFTCDVCGMQFRYLKSFKKHRLNHALERLHGKRAGGGSSHGLRSCGQESLQSGSDAGSELVTSSNDLDEDDLKDDEVQDETIDSGGGGGGGVASSAGGVCTSSEMREGNSSDSEARKSIEMNPVRRSECWFDSMELIVDLFTVISPDGPFASASAAAAAVTAKYVHQFAVDCRANTKRSGARIEPAGGVHFELFAHRRCREATGS